MTALPTRQAVPGLLLAGVAAFAIAALVSGCASARPEQRIAVTTTDGRQVSPDSVTVSYTVGGVRVIQRPNAANDVVSAQLYLLGGARQLTPATQGIESLLLRAAAYGTASYPGPASRAAWALTGSRLLLGADADWTVYGFDGIRQQFDSTWNVMADRVMHPTLRPADVALVRGRQVARLVQRTHDPDALLFTVADSALFAGQAYGLDPDGTESSLAALDSAALARYAAEQMVTSRMLLVVVGNVSRDEVTRAVERSLARLPRGDYRWTLPAPAPLAPGPTAIIPRPLSTNYVLGYFQGPPASSDDYPAFRVATALLGSQLSQRIREERALSYAAYAPLLDRGVATGGIYFSTTSPVAALQLAREEVQSIRRLEAGHYDMRGFTDQFVFDFLDGHTSSSAQGELLARAELYQGDYRKASQEVERLRHITSGDVRAAASRYFRNIRFVYVGDSSRVGPKAFEGFRF